MKKRDIKYIVLVFLAGFMLVGCAGEYPDGLMSSVGDGIFQIEVGISEHEDPNAADTRAMIAQGDDKWSYVRFDSKKDTIGFFSTQGNMADGVSQPFLNEPMVWTQSTGSGEDMTRWRGIFSGVDMDYDLGYIQQEGTKTYVYFPYAVGAMETGLCLRRTADDGSRRCVDALQIQSFIKSDNPTMSGTFQHAFAEIMFVRGNGFDKPLPGLDGITVVMSEGYSHAKIIEYPYTNHPDWWMVFQPVYVEGYEISQEDCRRWDAWKGEPYKENEFSEPQDAYYCILPTGLSTLNTGVEYIEVYDNMGELHKITSFYLRGEGNKSLNPSHKYKMNIVMEGLVPTIYPYGIEPWEDPENITDERNSGINNPTDLQDFIRIYNSYINPDGSRNSDFESQLEKFGNKYTTDGVVGWHFYLNNSFDMNNLPVDYNYRIMNLCDTIDGMRNTLANVTINDNSGFIGNLLDRGCIMNLNLSGLMVNNNSAQYSGGLVNEIKGGLIQSCTIDGQVKSSGRVGMAAALMSGGIIRNSTFRGLLIGSGSSTDHLIAKEPDGGTVESNNNSSGIFFTNN